MRAACLCSDRLLESKPSCSDRYWLRLSLVLERLPELLRLQAMLSHLGFVAPRVSCVVEADTKEVWKAVREWGQQPWLRHLDGQPVSIRMVEVSALDLPARNCKLDRKSLDLVCGSREGPGLLALCEPSEWGSHKCLKGWLLWTTKATR